MDFLVILEGTRRRVHHGGRAERRATVRGARRRGTRKGRPMLRESVRICAECAGRQVEQQRNGHYWQRDGQMPPNSTEPHGTPGSARLALSSCVLSRGRGEVMLCKSCGPCGVCLPPAKRTRRALRSLLSAEQRCLFSHDRARCVICTAARAGPLGDSVQRARDHVVLSVSGSSAWLSRLDSAVAGRRVKQV